MNKGLIAVLSFAVGAAAGGACTYLYLKDQYNEQANLEVEELRIAHKEEIAKLKEEYELNTASAKLSEAERKTSKGTAPKKAKTPVKAKKRASTGSSKEDAAAQKTNYNKIYVEREDIDEDDDEDDQLEEGECPEELKPPMTSMITAFEFERNDDYEKETVVYIEQDDCYIDKYHEVQGEMKGVLGTDWYPDYVNDPRDTVYVRNDSNGVDYEIIIETERTADQYLKEEYSL